MFLKYRKPLFLLLPFPVVKPVESSIEDDLDNDDDEPVESEELASAGDFWF
jgi:hypothetical protein